MDEDFFVRAANLDTKEVTQASELTIETFNFLRQADRKLTIIR